MTVWGRRTTELAFLSLGKWKGSSFWYFLGEVELSNKKMCCGGVGGVEGFLLVGPNSLLFAFPPNSPS